MSKVKLSGNGLKGLGSWDDFRSSVPELLRRSRELSRDPARELSRERFPELVLWCASTSAPTDDRSSQKYLIIYCWYVTSDILVGFQT